MSGMIEHICAEGKVRDAMCSENLARMVESVIEALSDPSQEMIGAGVRMHETPRTGPSETLVHDIWQAMIGAALTDRR